MLSDTRTERSRATHCPPPISPNWSPVSKRARRIRIARWLSARVLSADRLSSLGCLPINGSRWFAQGCCVARRLSRRAGAPGMHIPGLPCVEVTQVAVRALWSTMRRTLLGQKAHHRISAAVDRCVGATLRGQGRDIGDIAAWLTDLGLSTDRNICSSVLEEATQGLKCSPHRHHQQRGFEAPLER